MTDTITLIELLQTIGQVVNTAPGLRFRWVVAEISDLRSSGGHVYFQLVQKDANGQPVATMRANMWAGTVRSLSARYHEKMRQVLANGNEARVLVSANFHEKYGLSLNVSDIDPDYRKDSSQVQAQILAALKREGILEKNKGLEMPWPVQRVAVISAPGAAGYGDFMNQLAQNQCGIVFYTKLFESVMQGEKVSASVRSALTEIESMADLFDCVVIIRGGGATTDLVGFDDLQLARAVAGCMLPVIVGIGHERDNTVLDFIAHTRVKTPTAAAEWLIAQGEQALSRALELAQNIAREASQRLAGDRQQLEYLESMIPVLARNRAGQARARIDKLAEVLPLLVRSRIDKASAQLDRASRAVESAGSARIARASSCLQNFAPILKQAIAHRLSREQQRLAALADKIDLLSPDQILRRGYSITLGPDGRALRNPAEAPAGTPLTTRLAQGTLHSTATD